MNNIMTEIFADENKINSCEELKKWFSNLEYDKGVILDCLNKIEVEHLYQSPIHGLFHSEKVFLFAYIIAKNECLNEVDMQIIIDAAIYHDIARINDSEDSLHGYASTLKIKSVLNNEIYEDEVNLNMIKAIVNIHSRPDRHEQLAFEDHDLDISQFSRYKKLYSILKDADALDRLRFSDASNAALDPKYLRLDISKELIEFSKKINYCYYEKIKNNQPEVCFDQTNKKDCIHSIGFDFFKLKSIFKHGILSYDEMRKEGLSNYRNFKGGNGERWISVVDPTLKNKHHCAFNVFCKKGISFICQRQALVEPYENKDRNKAVLDGMPYNKSDYGDEKYVFGKIPVDDIMSLFIPKEFQHTDVRKLPYLYNSLNYEFFIDKVRYFMINTNTKENDETIRELPELLWEYKNFVDHYNNAEYDERLDLEYEMTNILEPICVRINKIIGDMIHKYYSNLLGKDKITTEDIVLTELKNIEIEHQVINNSEALVYAINGKKEEHHKTLALCIDNC